MKGIKGAIFYTIIIIVGLGGIAGIFVGLSVLAEWAFVEVTAPIAATVILAALGGSGLWVFMLGKIAERIDGEKP